MKLIVHGYSLVPPALVRVIFVREYNVFSVNPVTLNSLAALNSHDVVTVPLTTHDKEVRGAVATTSPPTIVILNSL